MAKYKVGDKVVMTGGVASAMGRPRAREIQKVTTDHQGKTRYQGGGIQFEGEILYTWMCSEESLVLESEFQWPSEFQMRLADKRVRENFDRSFESMINHEDED